MLAFDLQSENNSQKCLSGEKTVEKKAEKLTLGEYYNLFCIQLVFVHHSRYIKHRNTRFFGGSNTTNKRDKVPTLLNFAREATGGNSQITTNYQQYLYFESEKARRSEGQGEILGRNTELGQQKTKKEHPIPETEGEVQEPRAETETDTTGNVKRHEVG